MSSVLDGVTTEGSIVLHRFFQQAPKTSCLSLGKNKKRMVMSSTRKKPRTLLISVVTLVSASWPALSPFFWQKHLAFPLGVTALLLPNLVWFRPGWRYRPAWGAGLMPDQLEYFIFLSLVSLSVVLTNRSKLWVFGRNLSEVVPSSCWGYEPGTAGSHHILSWRELAWK